MKLFVRLFTLFLFGSLSAEAQDITTNLEVADSLFNNKRYTQSYPLYQDVYRSGKATSAMLLKMAFSEEAQDNLGNALYYLHDYYRFTSDERAVEKMAELAQVNALEGYEWTEYQKFQKLIEDNRYLIYLVLVLLAGVILFMMFRKYQKHQERSSSLLISLVLVFLVAAYALNFTSEKSKGIIMKNDAFIMSGPSAASTLVEVVRQGHKVEIIDKQDIWVKIKWKGQSAFVRESNLKALL